MNLNETKNIKAVFIIEVVGRPPEHLTETLKNIIEKMKGEKGVSIINQKINNPVLMKDQKDFYTNFAEVELDIESPQKLTYMVFGYMPAHVEVIYPENINLTNDNFTAILNELARRLHGYDEIARVIQVEKNILEKKLKSILSEKKKPEEEEKK